MSIFDLLDLIGGLALFLFGMHIMGAALEKAAGSRLKNILAGMTGSPLRALLLGVGVTAVIQSSSATTVMVVGFVNSGLMELRQAIGVIMGANIGTTVTAWLLSLSGISGDSLAVRLLKPSSFTPVLALAGILLLLGSRRSVRRDAGTALLGFSVLMYGMEAMSGAVAPLAHSEAFASFLLVFTNPILGVLAGALLTAVIQSSSASVGILQALSATGTVTNAMAIPIIMGQNIGTTVTALLSSVGTTRAARRTALVHFYFNLLGTAVCLPVFWLIRDLAAPALLGEGATAFSIAVFHSIFNIACTALLFPFRGKLEALAVRSIPESAQDAPFAMLDERLLTTPAIAAERCRTLICDMASRAERNLLLAISLLVEPSDSAFETVEQEESYLDRCEDALGSYLVKLSACDPGEADSHSVSQWLHTVTDLERIGDHAMNIAQHARDMARSGHRFSAAANADLQVITDALTETVTRATQAFRDGDIPAAEGVEPLEDVIDSLSAQLRDRHVKRLQAGECEFANSFAFDEILTDLERIGDHCSNIAACQIALSAAHMDMHAYRDAVKAGETGDFQAERRAAAEKYRLPNA